MNWQCQQCKHVRTQHLMFKNSAPHQASILIRPVHSHHALEREYPLCNMSSTISVIALLPLLLNIFWILAILSIFAKRFVTPIESALNYGKLSAQHALESRPFLMYRPSFTWSLFYLCGFTLAFSLYMLGQRIPWLMPPSDLPFDGLCLLLFLFHTARRFLECLFVHKHSATYAITPPQLICGVSFYIAAPLTLMCDALLRATTLPRPRSTGSKFIVSFADLRRTISTRRIQFVISLPSRISVVILCLLLRMKSKSGRLICHFYRSVMPQT